jgi:acyl carrier protein
LPDSEKTADAESTILKTIQILLARRGASGTPVTPESRLTTDLGLDSLELAELSAVLEDELGRDPYSEGVGAQTLAQLLAFYDR